MVNKKLYLLYGCILSVAIFILLFVIKINFSILLDIEVKWIIVAVLPILIALVAGEYFKWFNGYKISNRYELFQPLNFSQGIIKLLEGIEATENIIISNEKPDYNVLIFKVDKKNSYRNSVVLKLLLELENISFLEVVNGDYTCLYLQEINRKEIIDKLETELKDKPDSDVSFVSQFMHTQNELCKNDNEANMKIDFVYEGESAIDTFKKIKESRKNLIPVLNNNNLLVGVVYKNALNEYLANMLFQAVPENLLNKQIAADSSRII